MHFPDRFYYQETQSAESYGHNPQGEPNFSYLIEQRAAWPEFSAVSKPLPKKIILTDWRCSIDLHLDKVKKILRDLREQGFSLYVYEYNTVYPLENIEDFDGKTLTLDFEDNIIQKAYEDQALTRDEVLLLDDHEMDCLLDPAKDASVRVLKISDVSQDESNLSLDHLIAIVQKAKNPLQKILIDVLDEQKTAEKYRSAHPDIVFEEDITSPWVLNLDSEMNLAEMSLPGLKKVIVSSSSFRDFNGLANFIKKHPHIEKIDFWLNIENLQKIQEIVVPIIHLKLSQGDAPPSLSDSCEVLGSYLKSKPIKKISHLDLELWGNMSRKVDLDFMNVEGLTVDSSFFKGNDHFLKTARHLKALKIDLMDLTVLNEDIFNLPELKCLDFFINKNERSRKVEKIVSQLKNLENLSLSYISTSEPLVNVLTFAEKNMPILKRASFENIRNMIDFLNHFENIEKVRQLKLGCFQITKNDPILNKTFSNCKEIVFDKTMQIDSNCSFSFFSAFPNIRVLHITRCNYFNDPLSNEHAFPVFGYLEKIVIEGSISKEHLKKLIAHSPKLQFLDLRKAKLSDIDPALKEQLRELPFVFLPENKVEFSLPTNETKKSNVDFFNRGHGTIDADTYSHNNDAPIQQKNIFKPINEKNPILYPNKHYRLSIKDTLTLSEQPVFPHQACFLEQSDWDHQILSDDSISLQNNKKDFDDLKDSLKSSNKNIQLGSLIVYITKYWHALPSLMAGEKILQAYSDRHIPIEIKKSLSDDLYYIRLKEGDPQELALSYILELPDLPPKNKIPQDIQDKIQNILCNYQNKKLMLSTDRLSGEAFLEAIDSQKVGACRHRAVVFMHYMQKNHPEIPVRHVSGDLHAYCEIQIEGFWHKCDLGGHITKIEELTFEERVSSSEPRSVEIFSLDDPLIDKPKLPMVSLHPLAFAQNLIQSGEKKILIETESRAESENIKFLLERYCRMLPEKKVFYIDSPDDITCSSPFIFKNADGSGELRKAPGGKLYDFLMENQDEDNPPIIIVNYDKFKADDIVKYNTLIDENRMADGIALPKNTLLIGLFNQADPNAYSGADFFSRFDTAVSFKNKADLMQQSQPLHFTQETEKETLALHCYHQNHWEGLLKGRWVIKGERFFFEESILNQAIKENKAIEIHNGLWRDPDFAYFIRDIQIKHPELVVIKKEGYDWASLKEAIHFDCVFDPQAKVLNLHTLGRCFGEYHCENDKLVKEPGLIEQHKGGSLSLNLSDELSEDLFAKLLAEALRFNVKLQCHVLTKKDLPEVLKQPLSPINNNISMNRLRVIESNEPDLYLESLALKGFEIIDISEIEIHHFLGSLEGKLDKESMRFVFQSKLSYLKNAIKDNKKILLKGEFKQEWINKLSQYLLEDFPKETFQGEIILLSDKMEGFSFFQVEKKIYTAEEKMQALGCDENLKPYLHEPYPYLKSRKRFANRQYEPSEGMRVLPQKIVMQDFDYEKSSLLSEDFIRNRKEAINGVLSTSPFVFIAGITGVGKSSFVEKYIREETSDLFNDTLAWAKNQDPNKRKILFIDEANIDERNWSEFEGLFHEPPGIFIKGVFYPLSENHKVIFAGNPLSYGGERHLASLFERHGNSIVFTPLPAYFLYDQILKPIFKNTACEKETKVLSEKILRLYRYLCEQSEDRVLISPRECEMVALLLISKMKREETASALESMDILIYEMGLSLVPNTVRRDFEEKFKPKTVSKSAAKKENQQVQDFIYTPSREPLMQQMENILDLHEYKQSTDNISHKTGGLGGLVIEGPPGIGKSEIIRNILHKRGYQEEDIHKTESQEDVKKYYVLPISMPYTQKKALLLKAFDEGAIVMIDEINSIPMMERLLNTLLMGKNEDGELPKKSGFMIIGTQNPPSMAGRRAPSAALSRRLIKTVLPDYSREEMIDILVQKRFLNSKMASEWVDKYIIERSEAIKRHDKKIPCFRTCYKLAKKHYESRGEPDITDVVQNTQDGRVDTSLNNIKLIALCNQYKTYLEKRHPQTEKTRVKIKAISDLMVFLEKSNEVNSQIEAFFKKEKPPKNIVKIIRKLFHDIFKLEKEGAKKPFRKGRHVFFGQKSNLKRELKKTSSDISIHKNNTHHT